MPALRDRSGRKREEPNLGTSAHVEDQIPIRFGTSGWRGVLGEDVTFDALRALVRASGEWLVEGGDRTRILVGYDTRFASRRMAEVTCRVLASFGARPILSSDVVPTPVLTHAVIKRRAAGGLMLTASHNPAEYHGMKVFGPSGGNIMDCEARQIEVRAAAILAAASTARGPNGEPADSLTAPPRMDFMDTGRACRRLAN
jgi:phosphomannomutase